MGALTRYPKGLLARAWARSAALRMPGAMMPPAEVAEPAEPETAALEEDAPKYPEEVLEEARRDPATFCAFVLRDENGAPIRNAAHHIEFHRFLSDPANARCVLLAFAESGKTTSITIGRVLWELGHNPNLRVGILCEATPRAAEIVDVIARYIRESDELHAVFPHLRQARKEADPLRKLKGRPVRWSMSSFTVERSSRARDPSVRATGFGKPVQGARFDILIPDDLVTWETSLTDRKRKKLSRWFKNAIGGRLSPTSRVWFLNTAYHPKDICHEYANERGYVLRRFPLRDPITGVSRWIERWSDLTRKIEDLGGEGSVEVARQIDCIAKDESSEQFRDEWINKALSLGRGLSPLERWTKDFAAALPSDCFVCTGVDIGLGKTERAAETVLTTLLVYPSGWEEWGYPPGTYQVLWIDAGRWDGPEILERIYDTHDRFGSLVYVESNQAQVWLTQFRLPPKNGKPRPPPPILPFETRANKWHPVFGVASLGIDMNQGRVIFPCDEESRVEFQELAKLIGEAKVFTPDQHTGDRLMSFWIAREGARKATMGTGGEVDVLG